MPDDGEDALNEINAKVNQIARILALLATEHLSSAKEKAVRLDGVGMTPREIADVIQTTPHSVSVMLSAARRPPRKKASKLKR